MRDSVCMLLISFLGHAFHFSLPLSISTNSIEIIGFSQYSSDSIEIGGIGLPRE